MLTQQRKYWSTGGKIVHFSFKRGSKERKRKGARKEENPQINNQCSLMRKREEPMEEQNRLSEERDRNKKKSGNKREKVGEESIGRVSTQKECATKQKFLEKKILKMKNAKHR